jgi:hypothetical protein
MNTWRDRLFIGIVLFLAQQVHGWANAPLPNTQFWALIFFGSAATIETLICLLLPQRLEGQLCDHMLWLGFACIVVDTLGFFAYMTKTPSIYYNTVMWGLSYAQWIRLLFVDSGHARSLWNSMVRSLNFERATAHSKTATR